MQHKQDLSKPLISEETERALTDSQRMGGEILGELHEQRRALEYAAGNYQHLDSDLDRTEGVIMRQLRRIKRRRRMWMLGVIVMFLAVCVVIYFKHRSSTPLPPSRPPPPSPRPPDEASQQQHGVDRRREVRSSEPVREA